MSGRRNEPMENNQFGRIRSLLARNGVSNAQITNIIGANNNNRRTREQITRLLVNWLKDRPKET